MKTIMKPTRKLLLLLLTLPAVTHAQILVQDDFAGSAGALPDAAKFEWGGNVTLNGSRPSSTPRPRR